MRSQPVSQHSATSIGIAVYDDGALADPPAGVTLFVQKKEDGTVIVPALTPAERDDTGLYSYRLTPTNTAERGEYTATWVYTIGGEERRFVSEFTIVREQPYWESLDEAQRQIVENVYHRVSDAWDSTVGGPYLWELPQSNFGLETIARLMVTEAVTYINLYKPKPFIPPFQVGANAGKPFPTAWYGLLEKATFWALCKHLSRSYLEQPNPEGVTTARLDRSDYYTKWRDVASSEQEELNSMLAMLKRAYSYGVRSRASLVAGGIFPISYLDPARPRWPYVAARF